VGQGQTACSGSEAGSYLRLIDFVYHSTLGLRVIKKRRRAPVHLPPPRIHTCYSEWYALNPEESLNEVRLQAHIVGNEQEGMVRTFMKIIKKRRRRGQTASGS
jgi:hypothetical protein